MNTAKPLTKAEKSWLAELEGLFARCPSKRIGMYTVGDTWLGIYDKPVAKAWEAANPRIELDAFDAHKAAGAALGHVGTTPIQIDSCAG